MSWMMLTMLGSLTLLYVNLIWSYSILQLALALFLVSVLFFVFLCFTLKVWYSLLFFLVYMGGLLILFFYVVSLEKNPMNFSFSLLSSVYFSTMFFWGVFMFSNSSSSLYFSDKYSMQLGKFFLVFVLCFLMMFLLFMLWVMAKLMGGLSGSFRPFKSS